jgi:chloramphenicol 3-O-phosphotransferase
LGNEWSIALGFQYSAEPYSLGSHRLKRERNRRENRKGGRKPGQTKQIARGKFHQLYTTI